MNLSAPFIARPVATTLVTIGVALAGIVSFVLLPTSPLPQVDFPTIYVQAALPGASPETAATSIATPLERHLGQIADVSEMTSTSSVGYSRVVLQFGLDRNIDGAARDVQAAINAARADLPTSLKSNPIYRKVNPADAPIMILAMTSTALSQGQIYDAASTTLGQKLSQVPGVGQVLIGGASSLAVRVEINPHALFKYGIGLESVRAALAAANTNSPKGAIEDGPQRFQIYTNDQAFHADEYKQLIIAYRNGRPVRLTDVAEVVDSVEDLRNQGLFNNTPGLPVILFRQPGANIISTVDRVKALLPQLKADIPPTINLGVAVDRTTTIRASLIDVETTLLLTIVLVIAVVFLFLRDVRSILIPSVAVPISLIGTFGIMYLLNYSLDNLSLMALIVSAGFVVDDAIIVLENVTRHLEAGMPRMKAALIGAKEVGFTVMSMSFSLVAVFTPILLMSGIVGRLFREFAVTLSVAVLVSLVVSLTVTPMMCAYLLKPRDEREKSEKTHRNIMERFLNLCERGFSFMQRNYDRSLGWALRHPRTIMLLLAATIAYNVHLFKVVPKGFFPQQDTGQLMGQIQGDQNMSFQLMKQKLADFAKIVSEDPAVRASIAFTGGDQVNSGRMFISLKSKAERKMSADAVIARLRSKLSQIPGASLFLQSIQDIRMGGRPGSAQYQFTLQSDDLKELREWTPRLTEALKTAPGLLDVNSDMQEGGLETDIVVDRDTMSRLGLRMSQVDNTLYDAFGQRQVSTIYYPLNQYYVVMELAPAYWQNPSILKSLYVSKTGGTMNYGRSGPTAGTSVVTEQETLVPLSAFSRVVTTTTPLSVSHQGHFASATISFNLEIGKSLGDVTDVIYDAMKKIGVPSSVHGSFQGTAKMYQDTLRNEGLLVIAALLAVYLVLGILYESYIHPLTILSSLPSAGVGAILALLLCKMDFSIMALIGIILLIGIVKKNAIMMIDFAIEVERKQNIEPREAIAEACRLRFRPIMMTTMAALFGALPLAFGTGDGAEMRQPLGVSIVGGLIVSQVLTLFTTPVIYLYLDRFQNWCHRHAKRAVDLVHTIGVKK